MNMVNITIDGKKLSVPNDYVVLEAAKDAGIHIPTLCYLKNLNQIGACRMCLVEVKGVRNLQASCVYPVNEGMEVYTNTAKVREARKTNLELILSNHVPKCLTCSRNTKCELQTLASELNITDIKFKGGNVNHKIDDVSESIVRDNNKCILCRRCVAACSKQTTSVIDVQNRGFNTKIGCAFDKSLNDVSCIMCGQCIMACPVGALSEKSHIDKVWDAIANPNVHVVVQTAPAVRAALGEEFGIDGSVTGKMVAALKGLGFDKVFDTDTGADLTIMEEGAELLERIQNNGVLPMITSCSPGWIKFCEHNYPEFIPNLSTCKSPHMMFGAILKSYYAEREGIDNIFVVSIMPCTAKKFEIARPEMEVDGRRDVDAVLTTRELAQMIKTSGIDFSNLPDEKFDNPFGEASGAGVIFGASGGVMEAALRTVAFKLTGSKQIEFEMCRGGEGIKEFEIKLPGMTLRGAIVNGTGNARKVLAQADKYHFIEIMGCPGGCVTGGGQPFAQDKAKAFERRAKALYNEDASQTIRFSHENPVIAKLYDEYLNDKHKQHHLLHTSYTNRK